MAEFTVVSKDASTFLSLSQHWISADGDDGLELNLSCGAGVGSPYLTMSASKGGRHVRETIDVKELFTAWADHLIALLDAGGEEGGDD